MFTWNNSFNSIKFLLFNTHRVQFVLCSVCVCVCVFWPDWKERKKKRTDQTPINCYCCFVRLHRKVMHTLFNRQFFRFTNRNACEYVSWSISITNAYVVEFWVNSFLFSQHQAFSPSVLRVEHGSVTCCVDLMLYVLSLDLLDCFIFLYTIIHFIMLMVLWIVAQFHWLCSHIAFFTI